MWNIPYTLSRGEGGSEADGCGTRVKTLQFSTHFRLFKICYYRIPPPALRASPSKEGREPLRRRGRKQQRRSECRGRQDASPLRRAKQPPGTANGRGSGLPRAFGPRNDAEIWHSAFGITGARRKP